MCLLKIILTKWKLHKACARLREAPSSMLKSGLLRRSDRDRNARRSVYLPLFNATGGSFFIGKLNSIGSTLGQVQVRTYGPGRGSGLILVSMKKCPALLDALNLSQQRSRESKESRRHQIPFIQSTAVVQTSGSRTKTFKQTQCGEQPLNKHAP